jgi:hypothetical protein
MDTGVDGRIILKLKLILGNRCEGDNWSELAWDRVQWRVLLNMVMKVRAV